MCPSGTGRFIADSWFSDEPLPAAYTASCGRARARIRRRVGKTIDRAAIEAYLRAVDLPGAIAGLRAEAAKIGGLRGHYLAGLALCFETMWDLAMEMLGKGEPVPYERCVEASTGRPPEPSQPEAKRERVAELLGRAGYSTAQRSDGLLRRGGRLAHASASRPDGVRARAGRGRDRALRQAQRRKPVARTCRRSLRACRAPTSTSCPSRTPGSPAR